MQQVFRGLCLSRPALLWNVLVYHNADLAWAVLEMVIAFIRLEKIVNRRQTNFSNQSALQLGAFLVFLNLNTY